MCGFESRLGHMSEEDVEFPFTLIEEDGTEREISGQEARDFWQMIKDTSDHLTQRDGREAWQSAIAELNRTVSGLQLNQMGGYTPIQAYGTYQEEECYFRARHQHAAFSVGTYDKDIADWLKRWVIKVPFLRRKNWLANEPAPWIERIAKRVPGLRRTADVSGWNAKRKAEAQVVPDDDLHGAGYLTPAQCVVIIREILIPNLRERSRNDGKAELQAYSDLINQMAERYKHAPGEPT